MGREALPYAMALVAVIGLHLATNGTYGLHTDELYYLDCSRHPALGYVDFPPVVPLVAGIETHLLGVTPWTLRILPALMSGVLVVLFGLYARRLRASLKLLYCLQGDLRRGMRMAVMERAGAPRSRF